MSKKHYIIPIFVPHEGCPHNCVFCNQDTITGMHERIDAAYVSSITENYIKTIDKDDSVIEISFYGGTFTAIDMDKQKELLKVAKHYKDIGAVDYIHMSTRPDYIDTYILDNLKKYSVDVIELGIQSMSDEVLRLSGRGHTREDAVKASELIKSYGFTLGHQVMLGLPGDTFERDIETAREVIKLKPDISRIYPALVIRNTPMERMYVEGKYKPYSLQEAVKVSKEVYGMFVANDINVIRVGLQPTEEINVGKEVVAGPFHPAFRELVEGSIMNDIIMDCVLKDSPKDVEIIINPKDLSKLYANRKVFFKDMLQQLKTINIRVCCDNSIERQVIYIKSDNIVSSVSIYKYLNKKYIEGYFGNS